MCCHIAFFSFLHSRCRLDRAGFVKPEKIILKSDRRTLYRIFIRLILPEGHAGQRADRLLDLAHVQPDDLVLGAELLLQDVEGPGGLLLGLTY